MEKGRFLTNGSRKQGHVRALLMHYMYYGEKFAIECPTGSGQMMDLYQVAEELARRLSSIFLRGKDGRRPVYGGNEVFQHDPHWRDYLLFLRILPRRQRSWPWSEPPDRLDGNYRQSYASLRDHNTRTGLQLGKRAAITEFGDQAARRVAAAGTT
jgi:hypothetical protein